MVVLRALLYRMRQGGSWRTLNIFGNWRTIYGHWRRWVEMGIWEQILNVVSSKAKGTLRSIDSTSCKVHNEVPPN
ncbi:MAG: transposase [Verrucomicrobiaceae bacterium]|nr:transposase [Verrucomicrobiaceae bacterium]NCF93133.1 transposase [Verrucomicrobiaceae bacterium]